MTSSIRCGIGCCVFCALLSTPFASCGSNSARSTPDAAAPDTSLSQDLVVAVDAPSDYAIPPDAAASETGPKLDTAAHDISPPPDVASKDASVAEAPRIDAASPDSTSTSDAWPSPDIVTAMSAIQRIADPQVPAADSATLASDNAAFAFAAYRQLIITHGNLNLVFSPASISIALAMTYAGAASTTATEMAQALHYTLPPARLHAAFNALDQALVSRGQGFLGGDGQPMQVDITNALWAEQTYSFRADFLDTLAANYGAGVNLLDFLMAPEPSRLTINAWVAAQTEGKIQDFLPLASLGSGTKLVLTDAVYFNAAWNTPFDRGNTHNGSFTLLDGGDVTTAFMNAPLFLPATRGTNFVVASLPYADQRLSLVVLVPDAGQFGQVESSLDGTALGTLMAALTDQPVVLALPRFKVNRGTTSLVDLFKTLGMTSAFIPGVADFSGMDSTKNLFIAGLYHQAFINVGEKGTEAAAGTGVVIGSGAAPPRTGLVVDANRPFIYFVRDQPTGAILFMGRVLDPSQN
jgi:serpin B